MTLKERFYKAICILLEKFPEYDICIVGSSSLFLRDIKYKKPHDLDIVILNENIKGKPHNIYKLIVSDCALDETNIHQRKKMNLIQIILIQKKMMIMKQILIILNHKKITIVFYTIVISLLIQILLIL